MIRLGPGDSYRVARDEAGRPLVLVSRIGTGLRPEARLDVLDLQSGQKRSPPVRLARGFTAGPTASRPGSFLGLPRPEAVRGAKHVYSDAPICRWDLQTGQPAASPWQSAGLGLVSVPHGRRFTPGRPLPRRANPLLRSGRGAATGRPRVGAHRPLPRPRPDHARPGRRRRRHAALPRSASTASFAAGTPGLSWRSPPGRSAIPPRVSPPARTGEGARWRRRARAASERFSAGCTSARSAMLPPARSLAASSNTITFTRPSSVRTAAAWQRPLCTCRTANGPSSRLWDAETAELLFPFESRYSLQGLQFSPDGRLLALACVGATIVIDVAQRKVRHTFPEPTCPQTLSFSPDGLRLAVGCRGGWPGVGAGFRLWDLQTGQPATPFQRAWSWWSTSQPLGYAAGGGALVVLDPDERKLTLFDPQQKALRGRELDVQSPRQLAAVPQGPLVAVAGASGTIEVWDAQTGRRRRTINSACEIQRLASQRGRPDAGGRRFRPGAPPLRFGDGFAAGPATVSPFSGCRSGVPARQPGN